MLSLCDGCREDTLSYDTVLLFSYPANYIPLSARGLWCLCVSFPSYTRITQACLFWQVWWYTLVHKHSNLFFPSCLFPVCNWIVHQTSLLLGSSSRCRHDELNSCKCTFKGSVNSVKEVESYWLKARTKSFLSFSRTWWDPAYQLCSAFWQPKRHNSVKYRNIKFVNKKQIIN